MPSPPRPRVGVGVFVFNSLDKFLIGKRKGSQGAGAYALPGGHLEFGESFETCAARETTEETGVQIQDARFLTAINSVVSGKDPGNHYVNIFMVCRVKPEDEMKVEVKEPEKCEAWEWITWEEMIGWVKDDSASRRTLFQPLIDLQEQRKDVEIWIEKLKIQSKELPVHFVEESGSQIKLCEANATSEG